MILYYVPGACSLADHIALIETKLPYTLAVLSGGKGDMRTADGSDYRSVNPRGAVPAIRLDDGTVLTENLAILAHIADRSGALLPDHALGRVRALEALSYMATTVHGNLGPFFRKAPEEELGRAREALEKAFNSLSEQMDSNAFMLGSVMSIADCYLYWTLLAALRFNISLPTQLRKFFDRMNHEPSVIQALAEEGLSNAGGSSR
ncbi:glutathione binding-like protein [Sphingomonas sp. NFX23]|uniref:glutathione binding-like protein n=1 Tax=Sphingomonas sp. NFX23 TaxID=2819532 RepID=UPI003CFB00DE